jgi:hypothetical protein
VPRRLAFLALSALAAAAPTAGQAEFGTATAQAAAPAPRAAVHGRALGSFQFELVAAAQPDEVPARRFLVRKRFSGDLSATSAGEMVLSGPRDASGTYAAVERVTGRLAGRSGSFTLAHRGALNKSGADVRFGVRADSGTGGLAGLSGTMTIRVAGTEHTYVFDYVLPPRR